MKWWGRLLAADAVCLLILVILSVAPGVELPVTIGEALLFLLPALASIPLVIRRAGSRRKLWRGFTAVPPVWRIGLLVLAAVALTSGSSLIPRGVTSYEYGQSVTYRHGQVIYTTTTGYSEAIGGIPQFVGAFVAALIAVIALLFLAVGHLKPLSTSAMEEPPDLRIKMEWSRNPGKLSRQQEPPPPNIKLWRDFDNSAPED